jgi:hypothetical protein
MGRIKLWRMLSAQSRLSTDPSYIRNATTIFFILHEILPLFAQPWETPASRHVPPVALAKSKSVTAPSDGMVWLGAGLLMAAVIMTIWMALHG